MKSASLCFKQVLIERAPGFGRSGIAIDKLSDGINIIHGPNGSGKTTLARVLNALLWPDVAGLPRSVYSGRFQLTGENWAVAVEAGQARYQRNSQESAPPLLPSAEVRDRYNLPLHLLLQAQNTEFAETIRRESAGGYDLASAREVLGFRPGPSTARKERAQVTECHNRVQKIRDRQQMLMEKAVRLSELRSRKKDAADAVRQEEVLNIALELSQARARLVEARSHFQSYPENMARFTGLEKGRLPALRKELEQLLEDRQERQRELARFKVQLSDSGLERQEVPEQLLLSLRKRLGKAEIQEQQIANIERELALVMESREAARRLLGAGAVADRLEGIDQLVINQLIDFARESEQCRAEGEALKAKRRQFQTDAERVDPGRLRQGLVLLNSWQRRRSGLPGTEWRARWLGTLSGFLIVVLAIILSATLHAAWLLLLLLCAGLIVASWWPAGKSPDCVVYQREFEALGLEPPSPWNLKTVSDMIIALEQQLAQALLHEQQARYLEDVEVQYKQWQERAGLLAGRKTVLVERFGVAPDIDESKLLWLVERIGKWQDAEDSVCALGEKLGKGRGQLKELLENLNQELSPYGYPPLKDAAEGQGAVENLNNRHRKFFEAKHGRDGAEQQLKYLERNIGKCRGEISELYENLGLADGDETTLLEWDRLKPSYHEARIQLDDAEREVLRNEQSLHAHPAYDESLEEKTVGMLQQSRDEARQLRAQWQPLSEEIIGIETHVRTAKASDDLEAALAQYDQALFALEEQREQDYQAAAGYSLSRLLEEKTRDRELPEVFHRARSIFTEITRGRYRLELTRNESPAFRAFDTVEGSGRSLEQLSSATRVQLLIAVRLAFVESQEQGVKLPLILDETLANSDDLRARTIIEVAVAACRLGRQVFYFTAQLDEVGKWQYVLEGHGDVPSQFVDLAALKGPAAPNSSDRLPLRLLATKEVPPIGTMSYMDYAEALDLAPLDLRADAGALHLWYVLEDTALLYKLLLSGIERWGPLKTLLIQGVKGLFGGDEYVQKRAEATARVIDRLCRLWRIGRGRPVDRIVLVEYAKLSDSFLEKVNELALLGKGDAKLLIANLKEGKVKNFRKEAITRLSNYLEQESYLDPRTPLSSEELRGGVLEASAAELREKLLTLKDLDKIMKKILERQGTSDSPAS